MTPANVDVLTYHYDNFQSGGNFNETTLTPANVNPTNFGKLFSQPVDGYVYAQPLYKSNLNIPAQGVHNVAFVATEHDSVYAFDADSNTGANATPLWKTSFVDPANGITAVPQGDVFSSDIVPEVGITGTPVIDAATNTLYVVAKTKEVRTDGAHYVQRLHALDITTGAEKFGGPTLIGDTTGENTNTSPISVAGSGDGGVNGVVTFNARKENQRPALTLSGGVVYVAWASHGDYGPYHGWVVGFNAATLAIVSWLNVTPDGAGAGIWESGGGIAADAAGSLYLATGNGTFSANNAGGRDYGESVLRLDPSAGLAVHDYFTPYDFQYLNTADADLGSGATMLLPDAVGSAAHPHLMVETGKTGKIYLIDRDAMGGINNPGVGPDNVVQTLEIIPGGTIAVYGNPAYFQLNPTTGLIYYQGSGDLMKSFTISNGVLSPLYSHTEDYFGFPGSQPVISANGSSNGIAWALQVDQYGQSGPAVLYAYDAVNLHNRLYASNMTGLRDRPGGGVKFTSPVVTNGHVLVGSQYNFSVYGLFPPASQPPPPVTGLSVTALSGTEIHLTWSSPSPNTATGLKILRSTDNVAFNLVTTVDRNQTSYSDIQTFAPGTAYYYRIVATNQAGDAPPSNTASALINIAAPVLAATSVLSNSVTMNWNAVANDHYEIERSTDGVTFTRVGSVPAVTTSYTDPVGSAGSYSYRVHAFNVNPPLTSYSNVVGVTVGPVINHAATFNYHDDLTATGSAQFAEGTARLTNANVQTGGVFENTRITVARFTASFSLRLHEGTQPHYADGLTFVIQANGVTALGQGAGGLGYQGMAHSVAIKFDTYQNPGDPSGNSTGLFVNGAAPVGGINLDVTPINLASQSSKRVDLTYDGTTLTETITDLLDPTHMFTTSYLVDIPGTIGSDTAFVGFTGSTGDNNYWQIQDILNFQFTSTAPLPGAPTNLHETALASTEIDLSWQGNSYNESGFKVERSTDGTNFTEIATVGGSSYRDTGLGAGAYSYRVRAFNNQGFSAYSNTLAATLPGSILTADRDIGTVGFPGSATFTNGSYKVEASGVDIWNTADSFHFDYVSLTGDGEIEARVTSLAFADYYSKGGVMFRETLDPGSKHAFMLITPHGHDEASFQRRVMTNAASDSTNAGLGTGAAPYWVRLIRAGDSFSGYGSVDGVHWLQIGPAVTIFMAPTVYVGLAVTAHNNSAVTTATFDHVRVIPAVTQATHFDVAAAVSTVPAGTPFAVTVKALDPYNNVVTGYQGKVHFTSSDPTGTLPDDYTFVSGDNGVHTFMVTLRQAGPQTVTVADVAAASVAGATAVTVTAGDAASFTLEGLETPVPAGTAVTVTLTAQDAFGNVVTDYDGTAHFASSDPQANLPDDYSFTPADGGTHTFTVVLNTPGHQSLSVKDTGDAAIAGSQNDIEVDPLPAATDPLGAPLATDPADRDYQQAADAWGTTLRGWPPADNAPAARRGGSDVTAPRPPAGHAAATAAAIDSVFSGWAETLIPGLGLPW